MLPHVFDMNYGPLPIENNRLDSEFVPIDGPPTSDLFDFRAARG